MSNIIRTISLSLILAAGTLATTAQSILSVRDTITDPNIVYPHSFEADTHAMMQNWYMQNYTQLARGDYGTGTPVEATDEEFVQRLQAMPTVIEMPFNSVVKSYIKLYVDRRRSLVENMLGMSTYYMPIFEQALEAEGMPMELKYLPIIESALNPNAVSPAGATGLWQFMLPTARGLGMEINSLVDERRDPVRSSQMAARYLHQLYDMYGDWSLAIAAYNCGPGNVNKALRRAGEGGKKDFWEIYPYLPSETRGYVPGFIAANYAMNYYDKHNISASLANRPIVVDSVYVKKRVHFQQIADVLNIPIDEIRTLNPQYRQDVIPGDIKAYPLVLPSHQALSYIISEDSIVAHDAAKYARRGVVEPSNGSSKVSDDGKYIITTEIKYHKVKKGDTFSKLANRYGVTVSSIKKENGIKTLRRGRTIKIVTTKKTLKPVEPEETSPETDSTVDEPAATESNVEMAETVTEEDLAENSETTDSGETGEVDSAEAEDANDDADTDVTDGADVTEETGETEGADAENVTDELETEDTVDEINIDNETVSSDNNQTANNGNNPNVDTSTDVPANTNTVNNTVNDPASTEARHRVESTFNSRRSAVTVEEPVKEQPAVDSKPQKESKPAVDNQKQSTPKPVYHKVRKGDNLSKIAKRYHTTVKKIQQLNNMNSTQVNIGQRIRVK